MNDTKHNATERGQEMRETIQERFDDLMKQRQEVVKDLLQAQRDFPPLDQRVIGLRTKLASLTVELTG